MIRQILTRRYCVFFTCHRLFKRPMAWLWLKSLASSSLRPVPSPTSVLRRPSFPWPGNLSTHSHPITRLDDHIQEPNHKIQGTSKQKELTKEKTNLDKLMLHLGTILHVPRITHAHTHTHTHTRTHAALHHTTSWTYWLLPSHPGTALGHMRTYDY